MCVRAFADAGGNRSPLDELVELRCASKRPNKDMNHCERAIQDGRKGGRTDQGHEGWQLRVVRLEGRWPRPSSLTAS